MVDLCWSSTGLTCCADGRLPELNHDRAWYRETARSDFDPTGCVPIKYFDIEKLGKQLIVAHKVYTMEQIVDAYHPHRRTPKEPVKEAEYQREAEAIRQSELVARSLGGNRPRQLTPKELRAQYDAMIDEEQLGRPVTEAEREQDAEQELIAEAIKDNDTSDPYHPAYWRGMVTMQRSISPRPERWHQMLSLVQTLHSPLQQAVRVAKF